ncbi:hypothetical protein EV207_10838 [Scopulibacillus darangshiensis]|uniref:Uncharacterized protein n=1 Tax=Scopulibacillus darangshiensis TaxID=442528 RepID=A0A4R2P505_9BACL|nr:hypothetical protein [Scopulibacillus darangshiensis]TCP29747.1 hypothetical protein EV207_10838 [Scopulibacillus darangshiensis]
MLRALVTIFAVLLIIAIFIQYAFGGISGTIIQVLLWVTVALYLVYISKKIRDKRK